MADDNWLYGGGPDEASHHGDKHDEEDKASTPLKNGNSDCKTYESTFDEHDFEVNIARR